MIVRIKKLSEAAQLPVYKTVGAAGCDVYASSDFVLYKGYPAFVPLGISVEVPEGFECQVRPRSGLASKGVTVFNSPGTVDSDFRGELKVLLWFVGDPNEPDVDTYVGRAGDRVAQLVFAPVTRVTFQLVDELGETERSSGGWGSTGTR